MTNRLADLTRTVGLPMVKKAAGMATRLLPIPQPTLLVGPGASARLGQAIGAFGHRKILVVSDGVIAGLGLMKPCLDALQAGGTAVLVYDEITPDAPIPLIEKGIDLYRRKGCDAILAFGGGSVMDAAKAIGLAAANNKHPRKLVGYFKGLRAPPPLYAVPTTAGTGSEVTVAAVISDPAHERKLVIADTRIVPQMAALDPLLMTGLPPAVTAATGMDALTHAVEAYLSGWSTEFTDRMALAAVAMIFENLPRAYDRGDNLMAREQMALASTYAGMAFTRANVGNVHAIAHQLGGKYHTPHGLANAIMLPHVLRFSASATVGRLATLALRARVGRIGDPREELAGKFLDSVDTLSRTVGIPGTLESLREADIAALANAACHEADVNYPVPRVMLQADCEALLRKVLPLPRAQVWKAATSGSSRSAQPAAGKASAHKVAPARRARRRTAVRTAT
ncbi:MAG: iron-containing alcohol dehydrogenase [Burkholderiaceae bacterium]